MRPLRLRARNFRTFPDLDLRLEAGVVGILGELRDAPEGADSNGAGKSSILEAIDIALFGRRSLAGYLTRGGDVDELLVELTFDHAGSQYRVRRTYSAKGRGKTSVDLERAGAATPEDGVEYPGRTPIVYEPLTRSSAKETDALLCDLIGLSKETFRDSCYLRQGDGGYADPGRDPKQRKELLVEAVLGRDPIWPRLLEAAHDRRREAERELDRFAGERQQLEVRVAAVDTVRGEVQTADDVLLAVGARLLDAERVHAEAVEQEKAARTQIVARDTAAAACATAEKELAVLETARKVGRAAAAEIATARAALLSVPSSDEVAERERLEFELAGRLEEHRVALSTYEAARQAADRATAERDRLLAQAAVLEEAREEGAEKCPTCHQLLDVASRLEAIASLRAQADAVEISDVPPAPATDDVDAHQRELADLRRWLSAARMQRTEAGRLEERIGQLQHAIADDPPDAEIDAAKLYLVEKRTELAQLDEAPVRPVDVDAAARDVRNARADRETAVAARARAGERLTAIDEALARLMELDEATRTVEARARRDVLLEQACGRDGIPALIIENTAIPYIEAEASRILRALGSTFDVELRTQAETKSGSLRDTLDVVVIDAAGNEADFATGCSGGEQTRIGLALRIALARLLAHRRGAESRLLALDEPSYLDAAGMVALLEVLRGLEDEFDVILLVSHVAELRDSLDDTIVVVREGDVSRIAGAPMPAEVVA